MASKKRQSPPFPERVTKKALQAWQSELRRLERVLNEKADELSEWEELLIQKEVEIEEAEGYVEGHDSEGVCEAHNYRGCDCCPEDAMDGCDCTPCIDFRQGEVRKALPLIYKSKPVVVVGDEVKWLESLVKLKDKRK